MIEELVTPTGVFFWLLFVVVSGMIFATMPTQKNIPIGWGAMASAAMLVLLALFGPKNWVETVIHDPLVAFAWFGGYVAVGVFVGCVKWNSLLSKRLDRLKETEQEWMHDNYPGKGDSVPDELVQAFREYLRHQPYWTYRKPAKVPFNEMLFGSIADREPGPPQLRIVPRPWHYKSQWMAWSLWWPWSATYYVFVELLWNSFQFAWATISGWMDRWGRYRFRNYTRLEE